jgi:heme-degrading monooxygenase HmoA
MYGTIGRMRTKPGVEAQLQEQMRIFEAANVPGVISTYVYRMDADPNEFFVATVWDSKESYVANAASPAQHQRYLAYKSLLQSEPEWHDGEIVYAKA